MPKERRSTSFSIDGYEVSATFASVGDLAAISHAKQILLSAFVANASNPQFKGILAISPEQRDNIGGSKPHKIAYLLCIENALSKHFERTD